MHTLDLVQHLHQLGDIVAVEWPEVSYVETFEYVLLLGNKGFEGIPETEYHALLVVVHHSLAPEHVVELIAPLVVAHGCGEFGKVAVQSPDVRRNRHVVVVQDDEEIVRIDGCVVQSFECESVADGCVANQGNRHAVFLARSVHVGYGHAEGGGDCVACVAAGEGVIYAFGRRRETADAAQGALGGECLAASCQQFMGVCLMAYVV